MLSRLHLKQSRDTGEWTVLSRERCRDADAKTVYMAMSEINEMMLTNASSEFDDPQDDIRLDREDFGAVYRMKPDGNYNVHRMEPAISAAITPPSAAAVRMTHTPTRKTTCVWIVHSILQRTPPPPPTAKPSHQQR